MPQMTYPNQRMIKIHRESAKTDFLGIKNENWQAASRDLGAHALQLYLYLAANANNYTLALSPAAIRQDIGMARSTYHDQFHKLVDRGYLVPAHGNTFEFFEIPQARDGTKEENKELPAGFSFENDTIAEQAMPQTVNVVLPEDIEINNTDISTNRAINNGEIKIEEETVIAIPEVKEIIIKPPEARTKEQDRLKSIRESVQTSTFSF
ncbi:hypothetical protein SDC9_36717 [bioreactor metagenome]|uniref:Helix-turn-helix domain-containing protein n=1 Tax=bioreactor metagenome TaxID=1076179 RepID=A0A644VJ81_9ZZZZ